MRKIMTFLIFAGLSLCANGTVKAVMTGAGRFDLLIAQAQIVVKGKVNRIDTPRFEMIFFGMEVTKVLKSDGGEIPKQLDFETPFPLWPKELGVAYLEGQPILLVLQRWEGEIFIVNHIGAILPATDNNTPFNDSDNVQRKVFDELRAYLDQIKDETAKGLILVRLSQLGTKEDKNIFLPYRKSENQWLRRGALASMIRLNPTTADLNEVIDDFSKHLSESPDEFLLWKMYEEIYWASRCGSYGMNKELTERATTYLPIYRALIDKAPKGYQHVYVAIEALKDVGTREDIPRLYKYIDNDRDSIRHEVLEGIGRILGMKIKRPTIHSYSMPLSEEVKTWEKNTRAMLEQRLASEHIPGQ